MVAPARLPRNIYIPPLKINTDAAKLDNMYINLLGEGGGNLLSEETKWLAVTHKSFDFGRRGFNDRLSFLGKRTLELQADLTLLATSDPKDFVTDGWVDQHGREPFRASSYCNSRGSAEQAERLLDVQEATGACRGSVWYTRHRAVEA